jgi:hypothetical protein
MEIVAHSTTQIRKNRFTFQPCLNSENATVIEVEVR